MQYVLAFVVLAIPVVLLRARNLAVLTAIGLAANLLVVAPLYVPPPNTAPDALATAEEGSRSLRVLVLNVLTVNPRKAEVSAYLEASQADLVFLSEVDRVWVEAIAAQAPSYQTLVAVPQSDNFGMMALVSREASLGARASASVVHLLPSQPNRPAIDARIEWGGSEIAVLSVHTLPPMSPGRWTVTNAQMLAISAWADAQHSAVVVGDLNATPWSWPFRRLQEHSGLLNSQDGFGLQPTWVGRFPWVLRIPIDHVLHDRSLATVERHVGPNLGSDHLPVHVTLARTTPTR